MDKPFSYESFPEASAAARTALKSGDYEGAAEIFRQLPVAYPEKKQAVVIAAEGLRKCGLWTEGVGLLETAVRGSPKSAVYLSSLAEMYRVIGEHARAATYMQRYLDHDSRDPEAWLHLARLHDQAGNYEAAETAYANALERDPTSVLAAMGRGDALVQLGKPEDAAACYRRAVATEPKNATALFALGSLLMTLGKMAEGHERLQQSLEIDPQNARAHVNLGLTYFHTGNMTDAAAAARNALIVDETLQIAHVLLGTSLAEQGDLDGAITALSRSVANNAHSTEALFALAAVQTVSDNKAAAELALQRILSVEPDNREARHLLAALHGEAISSPYEGFAREAFDRVAMQFDNEQLRLRAYRGPAEIVALIEDVDPERRAFAGVADIGCGTGLAMSTLRDAFAVERAIGVDISPVMIGLARAKGLYDDLILDDAAKGLASLDGTFELVVAADLFPYLGNLAAFMTAARGRLSPGGLLAYSIESLDGEGMALAATGRFLHAPSYVEEAARAAGLRPVASRALNLRRSFGRNISGQVGLLQA